MSPPLGPGAGALPAGAGGAGGAGLPPPIGPSAAIVDMAYNPLALPATAQMLGWTEGLAEDELLSLRIYLFLIEGIRIQDAIEGNLFVQRYLEGPQTIWEQIHTRIQEVKTLWSITEVEDEFLQYLKNIVGWTNKLNHITDELGYDTLRRLIANSVALWKTRGTEDAIVSVLTLILGARMRSWSWFDYRWMCDETGLGHLSDGHDPWLISIDNDREMNVRIMDPFKTINRQLVIDLIKLMRPCGERVEITYLLLLDMFNVDGDDLQWDVSNSGGTPVSIVVDNGYGALADDTQSEEAICNIEGSSAWTQYVFSATIWGKGSNGLVFHYTNDNNFYAFVFDRTSKLFILYKMVAGAPTILGMPAVPADFSLDSDLKHTFRVQMSIDGATNKIICFIDGVPFISTSDSSLTSGACGFRHDPGGTLYVDDVEVLGLPVESDFVDINT